jgi:hypothetical protein
MSIDTLLASLRRNEQGSFMCNLREERERLNRTLAVIDETAPTLKAECDTYEARWRAHLEKHRYLLESREGVELSLSQITDLISLYEAAHGDEAPEEARPEPEPRPDPTPAQPADEFNLWAACPECGSENGPHVPGCGEDTTARRALRAEEDLRLLQFIDPRRSHDRPADIEARNRRARRAWGYPEKGAKTQIWPVLDALAAAWGLGNLLAVLGITDTEWCDARKKTRRRAHPQISMEDLREISGLVQHMNPDVAGKRGQSGLANANIAGLVKWLDAGVSPRVVSVATLISTNTLRRIMSSRCETCGVPPIRTSWSPDVQLPFCSQQCHDRHLDKLTSPVPQPAPPEPDGGVRAVEALLLAGKPDISDVVLKTVNSRPGRNWTVTEVARAAGKQDGVQLVKHKAVRQVEHTLDDLAQAGRILKQKKGGRGRTYRSLAAIGVGARRGPQRTTFTKKKKKEAAE